MAYVLALKNISFWICKNVPAGIIKKNWQYLIVVTRKRHISELYIYIKNKKLNTQTSNKRQQTKQNHTKNPKQNHVKQHN